MYLAFLSSPVHLTLNGGNILLWAEGGGRRVGGQKRQDKNKIKLIIALKQASEFC